MGVTLCVCAWSSSVCSIVAPPIAPVRTTVLLQISMYSWLNSQNFLISTESSLNSSELTTKNTDLSIDEASHPLNGDKYVPNEGVTLHSGNIYTSTPLTNGSSSGSNTSGAKHVTWRPETPPSPPTTAYTVSETDWFCLVFLILVLISSFSFPLFYLVFPFPFLWNVLDYRPCSKT